MSCWPWIMVHRPISVIFKLSHGHPWIEKVVVFCLYIDMMINQVFFKLTRIVKIDEPTVSFEPSGSFSRGCCFTVDSNGGCPWHEKVTNNIFRYLNMKELCILSVSAGFVCFSFFFLYSLIHEPRVNPFTGEKK